MHNSIGRRQFLLGGSAVAALAGLSACAGESPSTGSSSGPRVSRTASTKTPVYAQSVQITSLATSGSQPQVYPAGYEAAFAVYSGLLRFGQDMSFQPDLATKWQVAADNQTWTFELRDGVTFHDGTRFDADAVVSYFTRMLDKNYNLSAYTLWEPIARVEKVDARTVHVVTKQPYGALLNTMAHGSALIPSPAAVAKYGKDIGLHPVGTGPYQLDTFEPGTRLVVKAFPQYYGDKPIYDTITFKYVGDASGRVAALQAGQADIIDAVPVEQAKQLSGKAGVSLANVPGLQCFGIGLNQMHPFLTDQKVRQALNYAIDKNAIVSSLFRGYATVLSSPLAPNTTGYAECGSYPASVDKAKNMLAEAGFTAGSDGVLTKGGTRFALRLRTPDGMYPNDTQLAQVIQDQLKAVGVEVIIQKVDKSTFWDGITVPRAAVDFDLVLFGFNPSHGSGVLQLDALYLTNPAPTEKPRLWNFNWYSNSQVDSLIRQAAQTVDEASQKQVLAQAQKLVWDDAPYIWLYVRNNLTGYGDKVATPSVLPVVFTLPSRVPQ
jgi:ABC-type transport system substrate-binding protein